MTKKNVKGAKPRIKPQVVGKKILKKLSKIKRDNIRKIKRKEKLEKEAKNKKKQKFGHHKKIFAIAKQTLQKKQHEEVQKEGINTQFDDIFSEIERKKSVTVYEIHKKFGIKNESIIEMAKVFEETGKIEILYPLFGSPKLILKEKRELDEENN